MGPSLVSGSESPTSPKILKLVLNTEPPDLLGFSQVSGFYGPGAWAAWFLVIIASWVHLIYFLLGIKKTQGDLNVLVYLMGLNWAAIDLTRRKGHMITLYRSENEDWYKDAASVGAAITMVFWGTFHASVQLWVCVIHTNRVRKKYFPRVAYYRALGLFYPSMILIITILDLAPREENMIHVIEDSLPALYWKGMPGDLHYNFGHARILMGVCLFEIVCLTCYCILFLVDFHCFLRWWADSTQREGQQSPFLWSMRPFVEYGREGLELNIFMGSMYVGLHLFPGGYFLIASVVYVYNAYLTASNHSESCFFMPCAPQKISEMDQSGALFIGLVLFWKEDLFRPLYEKYRRDILERREIERND